MLANNVLSDPAACSLWFYADPMLFVPEPVPRVRLHRLLRHSVGHYLTHHVSAIGHVNAFGRMYDLYVCTGAHLLEACGHPGGAAHYRGLARALRTAYVRQLLSADNGWFVSWISIDGAVHDYCHTFVNGLAVAYGLVPPAEGRAILQRVVEQSRRIGFRNWHLGVPANLLPCRLADLIQPPVDLDGRPVLEVWGWPEQFSLTDAEAFGARYPDGTIHPALVWPYLLGLQVAGLHEEADRILEAMAVSAARGLFQNGIVNVGYAGAEHFRADGLTCGYEGSCRRATTS